MKWTGRLYVLAAVVVWLIIESIVVRQFVFIQFLIALPLAYFFGKQYDKSRYYHEQWRVTQEELHHELSARLNEKDELYRTLIEVSPNFIAILRDMKFVYCNPAATKLMAADHKGQLIGESIWELIQRKSNPAMEAYLNSPGSKVNDTFFTETKMVTFSGDIMDMELTFTPIHYGGTDGVMVFGRNITAQKKAETELLQTINRLNAQESQLKMLINNISDVVVLFEYQDGVPGKFHKINKAVCETLGYSMEEMLSKTPLDFIDPITESDILEFKENLYSGKDFCIEGTYLSKHRKPILLEFNVKLIRLNEQDLVLAIGRDITERKQRENRMTHMAYYDSLTELPNRHYLFEVIDRLTSANDTEKNQATPVGKPFAVLFVDLDGFKEVNDQYGHEMGDMLLKVISQRLENSVRDNDVVCRLGGDEFIILLESSEEVEIREIARRIVSLASMPYELHGKSITVTLSMGISRYPADGLDPETLIKKADQAMYRAKDKGKNTVY